MRYGQASGKLASKIAPGVACASAISPPGVLLSGCGTVTHRPRPPERSARSDSSVAAKRPKRPAKAWFLGLWSSPNTHPTRPAIERSSLRGGAPLHTLLWLPRRLEREGFAPGPEGTLGMGMRRFTRLTNGFSKKVENLAHAASLHYMHHNFARVHSSLTITGENGKRIKRTPAMAVGVADHVWTLEEIAGLLDAAENPGKE